jgi:hypothetical protein
MKDKATYNFGGEIADSSKSYALKRFIGSAAMILLITGIAKCGLRLGIRIF